MIALECAPRYDKTECTAWAAEDLALLADGRRSLTIYNSQEGRQTRNAACALSGTKALPESGDRRNCDRKRYYEGLAFLC